MQQNQFIKSGVLVGLIAALIALSAFIRIPMYPVPFTLQNYVVILVPMIFGARISFYGIALYLLLGFIGLPIFAAGGGIGYILKPTFGYLLAYLLVAIPTGLIAKKFDNIKGYFLAGLLATIVIDVFGSLWLYMNLNYVQDKATSLSTAFMIGMIPFIIPDLVKLVAATFTAPVLKKVIKHDSV